MEKKSKFCLTVVSLIFLKSIITHLAIMKKQLLIETEKLKFIGILLREFITSITFLQIKLKKLVMKKSCIQEYLLMEKWLHLF